MFVLKKIKDMGLRGFSPNCLERLNLATPDRPLSNIVCVCSRVSLSQPATELKYIL